MNAEQIKMVQDSWAKVTPLGSKATEIFYNRMFETYPELRGLFPDDMQNQHKLLFNMINMAVIGLTRLEDIVPAVQKLGQRHVQYGVSDEDYGKVGASLLWTLEQALGDEWTPELAAAWTECYGLLANTMTSAAAEVSN
ncbi:hemin receptor [bacterium]|nr:hemin receptor [bacterium]